MTTGKRSSRRRPERVMVTSALVSPSLQSSGDPEVTYSRRDNYGDFGQHMHGSYAGM